MINIKKLDTEIKQTKQLFDNIMEELHTGKSEEIIKSFKDKYSEEKIKELLDDKESVFLIAKDGDKVTGFLFANVFGKVGSINWIGVDRDYRNKGCASMLMENVFNYFKEKDCYKVELYSYENKDVQAFFKKRGFSETAFIGESFCGLPVVYMTKKLRQALPEETTKKIIIEGTAGQGVKLMGSILAKILSELGKEVSFNIVYGPSVRVGKIHAELIYSDQKIDVPFIEKPDIVVDLSHDDFAFDKVAVSRFGSKIFVNMIALGRLLKKVGINVDKINLEHNLPPKFVDKNLEAIRYGYSYRVV